MVHPDHETRIGAHRVFSVVLVPSSVSPNLFSSNTETKKAFDHHRTLSRAVSVFSSSAALFEKLRREKISSRESICEEDENNVPEGEERNNNNGFLSRLTSSYSRTYSMKSLPAPSTPNENSMSNIKDLVSVSNFCLFTFFVCLCVNINYPWMLSSLLLELHI